MIATGPLKIAIIAGEASGDQLGADLMRALRALHSGPIDFLGVGGDAMAAEGLSSLFPMAELSIMGLAEILPRALSLLQRIAQTAAYIQGAHPDVVVTIDSPGFNFRVIRKIRGKGIRTIHYVAPQAWAWRPRRARELAHLYDRVLAILPFEPEFFATYGVAATFVGHPVVARVAAARAAARPEQLRQALGIKASQPIILALPGSRHSEVKRLLPVFAETFRLLHRQRPELSVILPTVGAVRDEVREHARSWPMPVHVLSAPEDHRDAFAAADAALAASGTVALELLLNGVASVIAYRSHALTAAIARRLVLVKYISLPNILCDAAVLPEFIQQDCRPDLLADAMAVLLSDGPERQAQINARQRVSDLLGGNAAEPPSQRAAVQVLDLLGI